MSTVSFSTLRGLLQRVRIRSDSGSIMVLGIGLSVLALSIVTVVINVTTLWLARTTLNSLADGAALYAAQAVDTSAIYTQGVSAGLHINESEARTRVTKYLSLPEVRSQLAELKVVRVDVHTNSVSVTLSAQAQLPFGYFLPAHVDALEATAQSRNIVR